MSTHHHAIRLHGLLKRLNGNPGKAVATTPSTASPADVPGEAAAAPLPGWGVSDEKHKVLQQGHR